MHLPVRPISIHAGWVPWLTMPVEANGRPGPPSGGVSIKLAAAGDIHCSDDNRDQVAAAFAEIDGSVDLILLAGDLTTHGEPEQARVLADACRDLHTPVFTVLGNHDWQSDARDELVAVLADARITVLDPGHAICRPRDVEVGIVGGKGFMGGFPGSHASNFGEPSIRALYAETTAEVEALESGLAAVATCPVRVVLLHYAPTEETLRGEPEGIWTFLGTDRLAAPITEHEPDLVLHGHAHAGTFEGHIGEVPVFNVSVPVMRRDFWVFEVTAAERRASAIH
jgi:Icc-related predicted phosphoesterase